MTDEISNVISTNVLLILMFLLLLISAFFGAAEIAMMSINRYRLKHAAKSNPAAKLVTQILSRPDRFLTAVLIGNSFADIAAASIATIIGVRLLGEIGALYAAIILSIIVLIFGEIVPKIIASQKAELISYVSARPLYLYIKALFPIVWITNAISNAILFLMGVKNYKKTLDTLTTDELRTMVNESGALLSSQHQTMLTSIIDLESITVEDIMVPRSEIVGIDLGEDDSNILSQLRNSQHSIIPVYRDDIDEIYGVLHMRKAITNILAENQFTKPMLLELLEKPYFIPEGTYLHTQLYNFQRNKNRFGLVVDEYGDILGLVTLADILEEIVGEFSPDLAFNSRIVPQADNTYLLDGSLNVRYLNQTMDWDLPLTNSKTVSGMIIEYLELIPTSNTCVLINNYPIEILAVQDNMVKTCKIGPKLHIPVLDKDLN